MMAAAAEICCLFENTKQL